MLPSSYDRSLPEANGPGAKKLVVASRELPEPLLDSDEAASIMKIHRKTLQKLARRGMVYCRRRR
jgi:hypothetical protein